MADSGRPAATALRRASRVRTVLEALAALVVLVGLFFAADAVARAAAESLLVRNVRDAVGAEADPQVEVGGRFFLPQVVRGAYQEVHVVVPGIRSGPLRVQQVEAQLLDVRVPFHDVLLRDVRAVGIGRAEQTAVISYADLNAYFGATGRSLVVERSGDERVRLSGRVTVLGDTVDLSAVAQVGAGDGQLLITPTDVETSTSLGTAGRLLLGQRLRLSVPLGTLPFGSRLTSVRVGDEAITLTAAGSGLVLDP